MPWVNFWANFKDNPKDFFKDNRREISKDLYKDKDTYKDKNLYILHNQFRYVKTSNSSHWLNGRTSLAPDHLAKKKPLLLAMAFESKIT